MPIPTPDASNVAVAQAVAVPDISTLHPTAQGVLYAILFICIGLSILVPRIAFLKGATAEKKPDPTFAAVIVDNTALNNHTAALHRVADTIEKHREELDHVREEMRLDRELRRQRQANG